MLRSPPPTFEHESVWAAAPDRTTIRSVTQAPPGVKPEGADAPGHEEDLMAGTMVAGLRRISDVTPVTRERYVDFLRAASIGMVVLGHYLGTVITTNGGRIGQ